MPGGLAPRGIPRHGRSAPREIAKEIGAAAGPRHEPGSFARCCCRRCGAASPEPPAPSTRWTRARRRPRPGAMGHCWSMPGRAQARRVRSSAGSSILLENGVALRSDPRPDLSNKAAEEMRERLSAMDADAAIEMWVGTFHSFGLELVTKWPSALDRTTKVRILDQTGSLAFSKHNLDQASAALLSESLRAGLRARACSSRHFPLQGRTDHRPRLIAPRLKPRGVGRDRRRARERRKSARSRRNLRNLREAGRRPTRSISGI